MIGSLPHHRLIGNTFHALAFNIKQSSKLDASISTDILDIPRFDEQIAHIHEPLRNFGYLRSTDSFSTFTGPSLILEKLAQNSTSLLDRILETYRFDCWRIRRSVSRATEHSEIENGVKWAQSTSNR